MEQTTDLNCVLKMEMTSVRGDVGHSQEADQGTGSLACRTRICREKEVEFLHSRGIVGLGTDCSVVDLGIDQKNGKRKAVSLEFLCGWGVGA